jgi:anti-anti-sigma regulatory factor
VSGEDATIVRLQGDLRFAGAESVLATLTKSIDAPRRITLDLSHVRAMDGVARRLLDDAVAGLREDGHDVAMMSVKAGDKILFGKWSGTEVKLDGEDLLIMKESDILGVITGKSGKAKKAA